MTRECLVPIPKKKKKLVARRIKRKEEQIEANLNEDQRRVASQQRRML